MFVSGVCRTRPTSSLLCLLFHYSGQDSSVRIWSLPNKTHQFLQQTCVFNSGEEGEGGDSHSQLLTAVTWNANGKLLAGAVDNMINIWALAGRTGVGTQGIKQECPAVTLSHQRVTGASKRSTNQKLKALLN